MKILELIYLIENQNI
ncbi:hypothetical protein CJF30_00011029 [Rutstroemia sp. NJR-2017a BBW]|nr:hypothetical protein CJF30_00011029 [Rutstroemia sp. NJR-2017a BBW]